MDIFAKERTRSACFTSLCVTGLLLLHRPLLHQTLLHIPGAPPTCRFPKPAASIFTPLTRHPQLYSGDTSNTENLTARLVIYATDFATTQTPPFFAILPIVAMLSMPFDLLHKPPVGRKKSPVPPSAISSSKASNALGLLTLLLVALLIFYLVVFHTLANLPLHNPLLFGVHARFWMQPNVIMFALAGVGLNKLVGMVEKQVGISAKFGVYGIQVLLCCVLLHRLSITFPAMNQSDNVFFKGYATSILESLPQNSLLLINYDQQWTSIRYAQERSERVHQQSLDGPTALRSVHTCVWLTLFRSQVFPGVRGGAAGRDEYQSEYDELLVVGYQARQLPAHGLSREELCHADVRGEEGWRVHVL